MTACDPKETVADFTERALTAKSVRLVSPTTGRSGTAEIILPSAVRRSIETATQRSRSRNLPYILRL